MSNDKKIKRVIVGLMILSFLVMAFTGVLKFRELLRPLNIPYDMLPLGIMSVWHDWAGIVFVLLVFIHLFLQRSWFSGKSKKKGSSKIIFFIIGVLIIIGFFFLSRFLPQSENIQKLKSVEIRQYQGENLSSVADFRENSIHGPQFVDIKNYVLDIDGLVDKKLSLNYDRVLNHIKYSKIVTLNCVEGWSVKILWEGVLLKDLLDEAGLKSGANTVIFYAKDGYFSSLSLDYVIKNKILLAYKMNGVTLPPERGFPFQVIAEDKWGYKWVKWVTRIEVSDNPNFKGYWEKAGYSQKGDLNGSMFESK